MFRAQGKDPGCKTTVSLLPNQCQTLKPKLSHRLVSCSLQREPGHHWAARMKVRQLASGFGGLAYGPLEVLIWFGRHHTILAGILYEGRHNTDCKGVLLPRAPNTCRLTSIPCIVLSPLEFKC